MRETIIQWLVLAVSMVIVCFYVFRKANAWYVKNQRAVKAAMILAGAGLLLIAVAKSWHTLENIAISMLVVTGLGVMALCIFLPGISHRVKQPKRRSLSEERAAVKPPVQVQSLNKLAAKPTRRQKRRQERQKQAALLKKHPILKHLPPKEERSRSLLSMLTFRWRP